MYKKCTWEVVLFTVESTNCEKDSLPGQKVLVKKPLLIFVSYSLYDLRLSWRKLPTDPDPHSRTVVYFL